MTVSSLQRRIWIGQRIGWVVMSVLLVFTALGVAGSEGALNNKTALSRDSSVVIRYRPIQRLQVETELRWVLRHQAKDTCAIELDSSFANRFRVKSVTPPPVQWSLLPSGAVQLVFSNTSRGETTQLRMVAVPQRIGRFAVHIAAGGEQLELTGVSLP